jgi:hypothetical protein
MNFLDRFKPKANALHNALRGSRTFQGTGQSLGGGSAHHVVIPVQLDEMGPLGMGVEKMKGSGGCITSFVEPGSQAERAGIQRGDVVCFAGTDGKEEVQYADFLKLAKSKDRPLCFEVRRVRSVSSSSSAAAAAAAVAAAGGAAAASGDSKNSKQKQSAEAFARKQAMIAAAEARDRAHKAKTRPISRAPAGGGSSSDAASSSAHSRNYELPDNDPKSEASKVAVEEAKKKEALTAAELGYNPYETNRATAGQARQATVAVTHGAIQAASGGGVAANDSGALAAPNAVRPPPNALLEYTADGAGGASSAPPPPPEFEHALEVLVTSSEDGGASSLSTLHKLVLNATTKGQHGTDDAAKFRRVRLANPKISAAVVDPPGAIDVLLACGFALMEEVDAGESVLVYPLGGGDEPLPPWLPEALDRMQRLAGGRK